MKKDLEKKMNKTYLYSLYTYRYEKRQAFNVEFIITHEPLYMSNDKDKLASLAEQLDEMAKKKELTREEIHNIIFKSIMSED